MNPIPSMELAGIPILDLTGREFLLFYAFAFIVALVWTLLRRSKALRKFSVVGAEQTQMTDPYEIAYLAGGVPRCCQVAVLRLVEMKCVRWKSHSVFQSRLIAVAPLPAERDEIEMALYETILGYGEKGLPIKEASRVVSPRLYRVETSLAKRGLRPTSSERRGLGFRAVLPLLFLIPLGVIKVIIGVDRERPVILLGLFLLVTLIVAISLAKGIKRLTPAGQGVLDRMREPFSGRVVDHGKPDLLMLSTGLALMGPSILSAYGHPLGMEKAFMQDLNHMGAVPSSGGCSSGCGSDSGGGGGDGGGGCGGGCGGCGGGGGD